MKKLFIVVFSAFAVSGLVAQASEFSADSIRPFRRVVNVVIPSIAVPRVVEVPYVGVSGDAAVLDTTSDSFEPYYIKMAEAPATPIVGISATGNTPVGAMTDGNRGTYADFPVAEDGAIAIAEIYVHYATPVELSSLSLSLPEHVALPRTVRIATGAENGDVAVVVAPQRMEGTVVLFPVTRAKDWHISLWHSQPLRIAELEFAKDFITEGKRSPQSIRFLAQPAHQYSIYYFPDHSVAIPVGEAPNLSDDRDVVKVKNNNDRANPAYVMADGDTDGIPDANDNCVSVANADQVDTDDNGRGDVCDDFDKDGMINSTDNCPNSPNRDQLDTDSDRMGDVCDDAESRFTEKYPWLPWLGIGSAGLVLISLFGLMAWSMRKEGSA